MDVGFSGTNCLRADDGSKSGGSSPDGLRLIVAIDGDRAKGEAMSEAMAHTGTHIADLREGAMGRDLFQLEGRAFGVTVLSAISNRERRLILPGGYVLWSREWAPAEEQRLMPGALTGYLTQWAALSR